MKRKIGLLLMVIGTFILVTISIYSIQDVNDRFPNVTEYEYATKDSPGQMNGIEILPLEHHIYTKEEYQKIYGASNSFFENEQYSADNYRILVFTIQYHNTLTQTLQCEVDGYEMIGKHTGIHNGVMALNGRDTIQLAPQETQIVSVGTGVLAPGLIFQTDIAKLEEEDFLLTYWWYPKNQSLLFAAHDEIGEDR